MKIRIFGKRMFMVGEARYREYIEDVCRYCTEKLTNVGYDYFLLSALLALTAAASSLSMISVDAKLTQASVTLTPYLSWDKSSGIFWLPSLMLDSIMTPMMAFSPLVTCLATSLHTLGWFL